MNPMETSREEILEVSGAVRRQGWEAVNVRAVASACGVAVGTLYNYFPSRDALVAASVESVWKDIFHHGGRDGGFWRHPLLRPVAVPADGIRRAAVSQLF